MIGTQTIIIVLHLKKIAHMLTIFIINIQKKTNNSTNFQLKQNYRKENALSIRSYMCKDELPTTSLGKKEIDLMECARGNVEVNDNK